MDKLDTITKMVDGFMVSKVLFSAVEFKVFTKLPKSGKSAGELSSELGLPESSLSRLLNVCVALGLLYKEGNKYNNTPLANKYLVEDSPEYFGYYSHAFNKMLYGTWGKLEELIQKGEFHPALSGKNEDIGGAVSTSQEFARRAMMAQHNYSQEPAEVNARLNSSIYLL